MSETTQSAEILNIGNDETGRDAVTRRLRRAGYTVLEAASGAGGLLLASGRPVDLIILEVNLPDISGPEIARRLRSGPATAGIPILHLSAIAVDESHLASGLESGADAYLCEPVSEQALLAQVRTLLRVGRMQKALRESRDRYQVLLETTSDFIWEIDAHGRYTYCSPQMEQLWGLKPEEMIGKTPFDVVPADDAPRAREQFVAMASSPQPFAGLATRAYDGQGRLIFVETSGAPFFDDSGRLLGYRGITRDVTEQKRMEEALREGEARARTVIENSRDGISLLELDTGRYILMSPAQVALTGFAAEEMQNLSAQEAYARVHPDDREIWVSQQQRIAAGEDLPDPVEYRWKIKGGEYRWFSDSRRLVRDEQGRPVSLVGVSRDITEHKQMEEALREGEARRVQTLLDAADESVWMFAVDGTILAANATAAQRIGGLSVPEVVGRRWYGLGPSEVLPLAAIELRRKMADEVVRTGAPVRFEDTRAGAVLQEVLYPVRDAAGTVVAVAVFGRDVTEQKRAETALRESEEKYRTLFEMLPVTVVIHQDRRVALANSASLRMFRAPDRDSVIGQEVTPYLGGETREQIEEHLKAEQRGRPEAPDHYLTALRRADGEEFPAEVLAADVLYQGRPATQIVVLDITERVRMQEALRHSEARLRTLFAAMNDVIMVLDADGRHLEIAPTKPDLLCRPAEEVLGKTVHDIFPVEQAGYFAESIRQALGARDTTQIEYRLPIRGEERYFSATISPLSPDTVMVVARDITAVVEQRNRLLAAERARADLAEHLNEEINHRARNNLAMVSGLLQMQAAQEPDAEVAARLREAVARMRSFVTIHERIYAISAEEADLLEVIEKVAAALRTLFSATASELSVEGVSGLLPTRAATNLAVATNELMTNALKHGGAGAGRAVQVKVRIDRAEDQVRISVWNSGPPVPNGFDATAQRGVGLRLVTEFAEQYGGSFELRPAEGGTVAEFVVEEAALGR